MSERPKNLLLIMTDQQRPDTIGAYGNSTIRTPNLDRLAQTGALFERAYCAQPVCSPSRASLLTGLYPHRHGVMENGLRLSNDVPALAEWLRPADYACGYVGKWHLGNERSAQHGFEEYWVSTEDAKDIGESTPPLEPGYSDYHHYLVERGYAPPDKAKGGPGKTLGPLAAAKMPEEVGKPPFQAAACRRFLDTHREKPFFLMCSIREPHPPKRTGDPLDLPFPVVAAPAGQGTRDAAGQRLATTGAAR